MNNNPLSVPIAIVIAGTLIAASLYMVGGGNARNVFENSKAPTAALAPKVTADDHILGNPNADVIIIEYTDLECPFCKQFHGTIKQIMSEFGTDGKVAWVIRNFPLASLHENAPRLAESAECVASLAGNEAYFKFLDVLFDKAPLNERTDMSRLNEYAVLAGADSEKFTTCLNEGTFKSKVEQQFKDAIATGGQGTPHNILVTKDGKNTPLSGAQPYATVKSVIETLLTK